MPCGSCSEKCHSRNPCSEASTAERVLDSGPSLALERRVRVAEAIRLTGGFVPITPDRCSICHYPTGGSAVLRPLRAKGTGTVTFACEPCCELVLRR